MLRTVQARNPKITGKTLAHFEIRRSKFRFFRVVLQTFSKLAPPAGLQRLKFVFRPQTLFLTGLPTLSHFNAANPALGPVSEPDLRTGLHRPIDKPHPALMCPLKIVQTTLTFQLIPHVRLSNLESVKIVIETRGKKKTFFIDSWRKTLLLPCPKTAMNIHAGENMQRE